MAQSSQWQIARDGEEFGPYTSDEMRRMASNGQLLPTDFIWKEGMADWVEASQLKKLWTTHADAHSSLDNGASSQPRQSEGSPEHQFDWEWERAVKRFGVMMGWDKINLPLLHPVTNEPMPPNEGLAGTFAEWCECQTGYNRRRLLFELLAGMLDEVLKPRDIANMYTFIRQPDRALELLKEGGAPDPEDVGFAQHCANFAWAFMGMTQYEKARKFAKAAAKAKPENNYFQTLYADAMHVLGEHDAAHAIYSKLMAASPHKPGEDEHPVELMFESLFCRAEGTMHSPVMAVQIAESLGDPEQAELFWAMAETEFYASPHFQMHMAYNVANMQVERGFAKLVALVQEMPWLKEASLNALRFFEALDPDGTNIMPDFQIELRQRIAQNGWTTEGMHVIEVSF